MSLSRNSTDLTVPIHCCGLFGNLLSYANRFNHDLAWSQFNQFTRYSMLLWPDFVAMYPMLAAEITNAFASSLHGVIIWSYDTVRSPMGHLDNNTLGCDTVIVPLGRADLILYNETCQDSLSYSLQTGDYFYLPSQFNKLYKHGVKLAADRSSDTGGKFYLIECFRSTEGLIEALNDD